MNQVVLKNTAGAYFIEGSGFTGTQATATRFSATDGQAKVNCAKSMGLVALIEEIKHVSFAVVYIRKGVTVQNGKIVLAPTNANLGQIDPSKRRFATELEARIHGARFGTRRAKATDPVGSGTAGHVGYFVIQTNDAVNAAVNPKTGLTNSI